MQTRLLEALKRLWTTLWERRSSAAVRPQPDEGDRRWGAARSRFWSEFHEGQRQAEARSSRPK
jgi:hypothetical protein